MKNLFVTASIFAIALCACSDDSSSTSAPSDSPSKDKKETKTLTVETKCDFALEDDTWDFAYVVNNEINLAHVEFNDKGMVKYTMTSKNTKDAKTCKTSEKIEINSTICIDSLTYIVTQYASSDRNDDGTFGNKKTTKEKFFELQMESCKKYLK